MTEPEIVEAEIVEDDNLPVPMPAPQFAIEPRAGLSVEQTLIADWLNEQKSDHTRRSYERAIEQWQARITAADCCSVGWPHRRHAFDWRKEMEGQKRSPKTIDSRLVAVRSFYDHLCDREDGARIPINPVKSKKLLLNTGVRRRTNALSKEQVGQISAAAKSKIQESPTTGLVRGNDQRLLVLFLATTGCRIKEAIGLKGEDLGRSAGHAIATLTIKGGKRANISVDAHVYDMLMRHIAGAPPGHHVFQPYRAGGVRTGVGYTYSGAYRLVKSAGRKAGEGLEENERKELEAIHPHMLRATFITQAIDAGLEVTDVQDQVNHVMTETTRGYDNGDRRHRRMAGVVSVLAEMVDLEDD